MGLSLSKIASKVDPIQKLVRKHHLNWGSVVTKNWRKLLNSGAANSAEAYGRINNAYGVANDYKLDTRYRSLAELTGTK